MLVNVPLLGNQVEQQVSASQDQVSNNTKLGYGTHLAIFFLSSRSTHPSSAQRGQVCRRTSRQNWFNQMVSLWRSLWFAVQGTRLGAGNPHEATEHASEPHSWVTGWRSLAVRTHDNNRTELAIAFHSNGHDSRAEASVAHTSCDKSSYGS